MALHVRYNENGTKILCELKDISQLEINGYKYKESPIELEDDKPYKELAVEAFTKKELVKDTLQPNSKTARRSTRKSNQASNEKDIIL